MNIDDHLVEGHLLVGEHLLQVKDPSDWHPGRIEQLQPVTRGFFSKYLLQDALQLVAVADSEFIGCESGIRVEVIKMKCPAGVGKVAVGNHGQIEISVRGPECLIRSGNR